MTQQNQLTLSEQAEQLKCEVQNISKLSMFAQPAAIKEIVPGITSLLQQLCKTVDRQQQQIKQLTGGY